MLSLILKSELRQKIEKASSDKILKYVNKSTKATKKNIENIVKNAKFDVLLLVIDSDYDSVSEKFASYLEKVIERITGLGIKTVLPVNYDLNVEGLKDLNGKPLEKAQLILFPAGSSKGVEYKGKMSVLRVLKWVQINAANRFKLPDVPHLPVQMHEEYYKRKSRLEDYEENENKSDLELDDLIDMDFFKMDDEKEEL